ncbi:MAG: hypothetical protein V3U72_03425 [Candidatus Aenigmarchaeota archaeon]
MSRGYMNNERYTQSVQNESLPLKKWLNIYNNLYRHTAKILESSLHPMLKSIFVKEFREEFLRAKSKKNDYVMQLALKSEIGWLNIDKEMVGELVIKKGSDETYTQKQLIEEIYTPERIRILQGLKTLFNKRMVENNPPLDQRSEEITH